MGPLNYVLPTFYMLIKLNSTQALFANVSSKLYQLALLARYVHVLDNVCNSTYYDINVEIHPVIDTHHRVDDSHIRLHDDNIFKDKYSHNHQKRNG